MEIFIYKITNKLNGMSYIGLTDDPKRRWNEHIKNQSNSLIHQAIQRYGENNFSFQILERNIPNYYIAAKREIYYIEVFNTYGRNGYNKTRGGETPLGNLYKLSTMGPVQSQIEINRRQNKKDLKKKQQQARKEIDKLRRRKK